MSIVIFLLAGMAAAPPPIFVSTPAPERPAPCLPAALTRGATVVMLGMYGGRGARVPFDVGRSDHPVHAVAVTGEGTGKVVLVLSAYEPTVWDVSAIKGRIKAVVATGYYSQAVSGLSNTVPVRFTSVVDGEPASSSSCQGFRYDSAYAGTREIKWKATAARRFIGSHPRRFYGGYDPTSFDIDGGPGAVPEIPRVADIRAGVPFGHYNESPRSAAERDAARAADGIRAPARRIVEWDENGTIIRDEGGGTIARGYGDTRPFGRTQSHPSQPVGSSPLGRLLALAKLFLLLWVLTLGVLVVWLWRRDAQKESRAPRYDPPWSEPPAETIHQSPAEIAKPESSLPHSHLAQLASLSALTASEPLVVGLHRYGRALQAMARATFDADLADEAKAIRDRHFSHAVARYRQARPSLDGAEADVADETLRRALERLKARLEELIDEQHRRDMDGIDAAGRFIDSRHPSD